MAAIRLIDRIQDLSDFDATTLLDRRAVVWDTALSTFKAVAVVNSFNGRSNAVIPESGDYSFAQIGSKPTTLSGYGITDAQGVDSDLTAIAALTTTSFGRGLLTEADAASLKTTLGLVTGSNVQAWDADLDAIAALSGTSGLLSKTGANTWSLDTNTYATRVYADSLVVGLLDDRGNFNASANVFPSSGGSGSADTILKGDLWTISVAGTLGGVAVTAGDVVRALADTPGQTSSNWAIGENNFGYVALNQALADGKIYVGNVSGIGTAVAPTGDVTFDNAGVFTIGATKVTNAMLAGSIPNNKLANSAISGVALGSNLGTLTIGTGLSGTSYNGSAGVTIATVQDIATTATPQFARLGLGAAADGTALLSVNGALLTTSAGAFSLTGAAGNMTITSGTGNSRTMIFKTTTSGGVATTFLTGNADQSTTLAGSLTTTGITTSTATLFGQSFVLIGVDASRYIRTPAGNAIEVSGVLSVLTSAGVVSNQPISLSSSSLSAIGDVILRRAAAANLGLGLADVDTAPVAQKLSVQNALTGGTNNVAGADFTIAGSQGKGTGAGGSLIFQVAPAGSTGNSVNALATALNINSSRQLGGYTDSNMFSGDTVHLQQSLIVPGLIGSGGTILLNSSNGAVGISLGNSTSLSWSSNLSATDYSQLNTVDLQLRRGGAANLVHGKADAAAPVAQTISVQNVVAGTVNTAGVDWTLKASAGTGTAAGGSFIFQVASAGSSGSTQNSYVTALTIDSTKLVTFSGNITFSGGSLLDGSTANVIDQRNSTNGQAHNVYHTYTNASTYRRIGVHGTQIFLESSGVTAQEMEVGNLSAAALTFRTNNAQIWQFTSAGVLTSLAFNNIGSTSTDGIVLQNTTAAASGAQQWSPRLHFIGQGWKTTATAASQTVDWIAELQPVQGAANPTGNLVFSRQINGAGYTIAGTLDSSGNLILSQALSGSFVTGDTRGYHGHFGAAAYIGAAAPSNGVTNGLFVDGTGITMPSGMAINVTSGAIQATVDLVLRRRAAANWNLGAADGASPVAQKLSTQGSRGGTDSNVSGANLTIVSGLGTGSSTPSSLILQSPLKGSTGTTAQVATTGLSILNGSAVLTNYIVANLPDASVCGAGALVFVTDSTVTAITGLGLPVTGSGANKVVCYSDGTSWLVL